MLIGNGEEEIGRSFKALSHDERIASKMTIDIHFYDVDICQHPEILSQVRGHSLSMNARSLGDKGSRPIMVTISNSK